MDRLIVTILGGLAVILTYWFFLGKRSKEVMVVDSVDITVEGGYSPGTIVVPRGKTTKINFVRKDPSDCLAEVVLGDFKIRRELPLDKKVTVEITPQKSGEYTFACGMNMFKGKIIVRD